MKRYQSLDLAKGFTILGVIFFHAGMQFFDHWEDLNLENPQILIILLTIMAMWGGLFVMISGITNIIASFQKKEKKIKTFYPLFIFSILIIFIHFFYNLIVAPADSLLVNYHDNQRKELSGLNLLERATDFKRSLGRSFPPMERWYENSSLLTIGFNLMIVSFLLPLIMRIKLKNKFTMPILIFFCCLLTIFLNYSRVQIESIPNVVDYKNNFSALLTKQTFSYNSYQKISKVPILDTIIKFIFALIYERPYPIFPYLGFTLFGCLIGLSIARKKYFKDKYLFLLTGFILSLIGLINLFLNKPTDIFFVNTFWFNKTIFEFGFFILNINIFIIFFDYLNKKGKVWFKNIQNLGFVSLSIYIFQTPLTYILHYAIKPFIKIAAFNLSDAMYFSIFNIIIWLIIVKIWSKFNFKFGIEYWLDKLYPLIKRKSYKFTSIKNNKKKQT